MARCKAMPLWRRLAAVLVAIGCAGALVAVFLVWREGEIALARARDLASRRPEASVIKSGGLPDINGLRTFWLKMVPFAGGALAVGRTAMDAPPVVVALDSNGIPKARDRLPGGACDAIELVSIGSENALAACATGGKLIFVHFDFDGGRLLVSVLPGTMPYGAPVASRQVMGSALGPYHFWLSSLGKGSFAIGFGEGVKSPAFASLAGVSQVSDLAALSGSEAVLTTVENESNVELLVTSPTGRVKRRALVTNGTPDLAIARPQVFVDHAGILVAWVQRERQPISAWFAPDKSVLLIRRFSFALRPLSEPEPLSEDSFVVPFSVEQTAAGGMIVWDQGVRGSWDVPSFVWLDSTLANKRGPALRIPSRRWPTSVVATETGILALLSYDDVGKRGNDTIVFRPR